MSEPMSSGEIEDVLSSIRRLVSEDFRPARPAMVRSELALERPEPAKLLLTPALRIVPGQEDAPLPPDEEMLLPSAPGQDADVIWQADFEDAGPEAGFHADAEPETEAEVTGAAVVSVIGAAVARQGQDWEPEDGDTALDVANPAPVWPQSEEHELAAAEAEVKAAKAPPGSDGWDGDADDDEDMPALEPEDGVGEEPDQVGTDTDDEPPVEIEDDSDGDGSDDPAPQDWPEPEGDPEADDQSGNDADTGFEAASPVGDAPDTADAPVFDDEEDHDEYYEGGADTDMPGTEVRCDIHPDDADSDGGEVDVAFDGIEARRDDATAFATEQLADAEDFGDDEDMAMPPLPRFRSDRRHAGSTLADEAERQAVAEITATSTAAREAENFPEGEAYLDEAVLREVVRELIRAELTGDLGTRITRNVRKLVRAEINLALTAREME